MRIYILGFMGAGKSSYAQRLATHLSYHFIDLDSEIENSEKQSVSEVWQTKGEKYFRKIEQTVLKKTALHPDTVVACGGGTPVFSDNMEFMNRQGITIYLKPGKQLVLNRLKNNRQQRPLISDMNDMEIEKFMDRHLKKRNL